MSVLAIEVGGTGVTTVVVSSAGEVVARGYEALTRGFPRSGWVEQAPDGLWLATLSACRQAVAQVDVGELHGIGITAEAATVLLWDRDTLGSPRPAIAREDRRTTELCAQLREAGHEERVREVTGAGLGPELSAPTLRWLSAHEPRTWALVESGRYAVGTIDSYLVARLTRGLEHVTDVSHASSTLLLDLAAGEWSRELCSLFAVPHDALPDLVPTWGELAMTDPRSFLDLELPITAIVGDRAAALAGGGCFDVGEAVCHVGAAGTEPSFVLNTGAAQERSANGRPSAAWQEPDGATTYAVDSRTPLHGAMSSVWLQGAGANDDRRCQQLADVLGVRVERAHEVETAAPGAAFLAGLGAGAWGSTDELRGLRQPGRSFLPEVLVDPTRG